MAESEPKPDHWFVLGVVVAIPISVAFLATIAFRSPSLMGY
jgi:hypothetical protein